MKKATKVKKELVKQIVNVPYVKEVGSDGKVLNPIGSEGYINRAPNRKERRLAERKVKLHNNRTPKNKRGKTTSVVTAKIPHRHLGVIEIAYKVYIQVASILKKKGRKKINTGKTRQILHHQFKNK